MTLPTLESSLRNHTGEFTCQQIHGKQTKVVRFAHVITPPTGDHEDAPRVGKLRAFYKAFGSVLFYHDEKSGDAARHLAPIEEWPELQESFEDWIVDLDEDEREEILPDWIEKCVVVGETPLSGNYILVPTAGDKKGCVFEFDHDGFEFVEVGADIVDYAEKLLAPDGARLTDFASHMRFVEAGDKMQWWIQELRDNRGHVARTKG